MFYFSLKPIALGVITLDNGLGPNRWQAVIQTIDPVWRRLCASLEEDELTWYSPSGMIRCIGYELFIIFRYDKMVIITFTQPKKSGNTRA